MDGNSVVLFLLPCANTVYTHVYCRILYVAMTIFMVTYVIIAVAMKTPENLWSLLGLVVYPLILFLYSNNRWKVSVAKVTPPVIGKERERERERGKGERDRRRKREREKREKDRNI